MIDRQYNAAPRMAQEKLVDFMRANTYTSLREDVHREGKQDDTGLLITLYQPRRQNHYGVVKEIPSTSGVTE